MAMQYCVLVVDDEPLVRQATMRALSRVGFRCEAAADGAVALEMARQTRYDVVVTDLRMPDANGHQLAVDLLGMPDRPEIVILTGIMEPRLANDLKLRGVQEIFFKPVHYDVLAKQVLVIADRRAFETRIEDGKPTEEQQPAERAQAIGEKSSADRPRIATQLAKAVTNLRRPPKDFDGFSKASANAVRAHDVGQAMELDPSMRQDVLAFVNHALYGSHRALVDLERSLAALQRRNAVVAVCSFVAGAMVGSLLAWLMPMLLR
ncbi:MAG: response regulator [Pirellulales bacterium]